MYSNALVLLSFAFSTLTFARPSFLKARQDPTNVWAVTSYTRGCSPGGCVYQFNVSAPTFAGEDTGSGFTTSCSGPVSEDTENYEPDTVNCVDSSVIWKLDIQETFEEFYVSHVWTTTG